MLSSSISVSRRIDWRRFSEKPLAAEVGDQCASLGVGEHATRLLLEHDWLVQRTRNGGFEKLVVWNAAPQEEREPRGELEIRNAMRLSFHHPRRLALEPKHETWIDEHSREPLLDAGIESTILAACFVKAGKRLHISVGHRLMERSTRNGCENLLRACRF